MKRLLLIALIAGSATPAQAHEFLCRGWRITGYYNDGCPAGQQDNDSCGCLPNQPQTAPVWYGAQLTMVVENEGGNGLSASQFVSASREAAQGWNDVSCSNLMINASGTIGATSSARWGSNNNNDNEHGVFYVTGENEWMQVTGSGGGGTLGVTVSPYSSWSCNNREFYDTDILINGFIYGGWSVAAVRSTIQHEMGHSIGLGHPCLSTFGSCSNSCQAVMAATSGVDYPVPQQDDVNGVCALYPGTPGGLGSSCDDSGDCTSGPCITYQGFTYCTQSCTTTCPTGYKCELVNSSNVCVRKGAPDVGEACNGVCAEGAMCVGTGEGEGQCYLECNPTAPNCPGQDRCVELENGGGVCWPPGTQQIDEVCGSPESGDCAPGLVCISDEGTATDPIAHCYRECDGNSCGSCGSNFQCYDLGDATHTGICLVAAAENQDCVATEYVCPCDFECVPPADNSAGFVCIRSCDWNVATSCGEGLVCVTFVDSNQNPVAGACYPEGDNVEGDACVSGMDCLPELLCITTGAGGGGECLAQCDPALAGSDCPRADMDCASLTGGGGACLDGGGGSGCTCDTTPVTCDTGCACDPACGGGGTTTPTLFYLDECTSSAQCISGLCKLVADGRQLCVIECNPALGHFDCPPTDNSGCVPNDANNPLAGGLCNPNAFSPNGRELGESCSDWSQCLNGLCQDDVCLVACESGACPSGYACDQSLTAVGVCEPGGVCGCPQTGAPGLTPMFGVIVFGLWNLRLRRRRQTP